MTETNQPSATMPQLPLRVFFIGGYWMGSNDVVHLIFEALQDVVATVEEFNVDQEKPRGLVSGPDYGTTGLQEISDSVVERINAFQPDVILCCAGGLTFSQQTSQRLREKYTLIGLALSDPDVFPMHGRLIASRFTHYYTNAVSSLVSYRQLGLTAGLFPFACNPRFHRPLDVPKQWDVVVVGNARPDRQVVIDQLASGFSVGLYGNGWTDTSQAVHGENFIRAVNSGKLYLSFSRTMAGFTNVKVGVFEAAGCGQTVITEYFPEMNQYFTYEQEIIGYRTPSELIDRVAYYLDHPVEREQIATAMHQRALREHTWQHRLRSILKPSTNHN